MIQSRKFVAAAILVGIALIVAGLLMTPFNASARAAATVGPDVAVDRIGVAFASLSERQPDPAVAAAAVRASKGDLGIDRACVGAVWPNIEPACLSAADGAPVEKVRMITFGYQSDPATTVVVRFPAGEVVSR
jgi:hypothetical protein